MSAVRAGRDIAPEVTGGALALALKRIPCQEDPPAGTRQLSRAFRAAHFRMVEAAGAVGIMVQSQME
eukprot:6192603-Pleurochrysis_carterae.AAC.2